MSTKKAAFQPIDLWNSLCMHGTLYRQILGLKRAVIASAISSNFIALITFNMPTGAIK